MVLDEECGGLQGEKGQSPLRRGVIKTVNGERETYPLTVFCFPAFSFCDPPDVLDPSVLERETQLQSDLPVSDPSSFDVAPGVDYLKPPEIPDGFRGFCHRFLYSIIHAFG